jgi:hypothetical protein
VLRRAAAAAADAVSADGDREARAEHASGRPEAGRIGLQHRGQDGDDHHVVRHIAPGVHFPKVPGEPNREEPSRARDVVSEDA